MIDSKKQSIREYNNSVSNGDRAICELLMKHIDTHLDNAESKIWHGSPVWFLDGNPVVGYSKIKAGIKLIFWSGADFSEPGLNPGSGKFKDASKLYTSADQIVAADLERWLKKSITIQWDYKSIVKRKGVLLPITQ